MNATQSIYKLPNSKKNEYHTRPTQLMLSTKLGYVLSVLSWRKFGSGKVFLYTDKESLVQLRNAGLESLWDSIDSEGLSRYKSEFTGDLEYPNGLWSAPKVEAWRLSLQENGESVSVDTDLWLLQDFEETFRPKAPFFLHKDPRGIYPRKSGIPFGPFFPQELKLDWAVNPQNAGLFYFPPGRARDHYFDLAYLFSRDNKVVSESGLTLKQRNMLGGWPAVYMEQQLMPQVAALYNLPIHTLLSWREEGPEDFRASQTQALFHLWMKKAQVEKWERTKWWHFANRRRWNKYMKHWGQFLLTLDPNATQFFTKKECNAIFGTSNSRLS